MLQIFGLTKLNINNRNILKGDQSHIIIANHPTLLDVVILISLCPNSTCIVKKELWSNPFLRGVVSIAGYIPNEHPEKLVKNCQQALDKGENLIIFPEGTRTKADGKLNFKPGYSYISTVTGANIRIVHILCSPRTLAKGSPWYNIPEKKALFDVTIGPIVKVSEHRSKPGPTSTQAKRLNEHILSKFYFV